MIFFGLPTNQEASWTWQKNQRGLVWRAGLEWMKAAILKVCSDGDHETRLRVVGQGSGKVPPDCQWVISAAVQRQVWSW